MSEPGTRSEGSQVVLLGHTRTLYVVGVVLLLALHLFEPVALLTIEDRIQGTLAGFSALVRPRRGPEGVAWLQAPEPGRLVETLGELDRVGATAVFLDLPPGEATTPPDLEAAIRRFGRVVLPARVDPSGGRRLLLPPEPLREAAAGIGFLHARGLGTLRPRVSLGQFTRDADHRSAAVELIRVAWDLPAFHAVSRPDRVAWKPKPGGAEPPPPVTLAVDGSAGVDGWVAALVRPVEYPGTGPLPQDLLGGRVVLVMADRDGRGDQARALAAAVQALIEGRTPRRLPGWLEAGLLLSLGMAVAVTGFLRSPGATLAVAAASGCVLGAAALAAALDGRVEIPVGRGLSLLAALTFSGWLRYRFRPMVGVTATTGATPSAREAQAALALGIKLLQQGQTDESIKYFQKVARLESELKDRSRYFLALVLLRRGDAEAATSLVSAIDFTHLTEHESGNLADELEKRGRLDTACTLLEKVSSTGTGSSELFQRLEGLKARLSRVDQDEMARTLAVKILDRRFVEVELIGSGGMGFVFRAKDEERSGERVAIKVLSPFLANHQEVRERFLREAHGLRGLEHPGLVKVYDVFPRKLPYYSMEFLEALSLKELIAGSGRIPVEVALEIAIRSAAALAYAHAQQVVHRDLKPENIMIEGASRPKVIDFGIARFTAESQLTATGQHMGTPKYMSPEQLMGGLLDHRTDVYSLALVVWEMLAGAPPFEVAGARLRDPPPPLPPEVGAPPGLSAVLVEALAKDQAGRTPTMEKFQEALERVAAAGRGGAGG